MISRKGVLETRYVWPASNHAGGESINRIRPLSAAALRFTVPLLVATTQRGAANRVRNATHA
ncbi:hypothetical protein Pla52o_14650 [Novipirellula galeiformis]|uniref:Uncharacterized protein n=1 Tax=Novipirellula galeiformis TaxID=2528004 RepID=A0A5C6CNH8_9BACT|nr:hypothetical protein Pla52o_14650 [Novipirellula galeiformis]